MAAAEALKIISFDPGGTTGWCIHNTRIVTAGVRQTEGEVKWRGGQLRTNNHHRDLWRLLTSESPDVIVCEKFDYRVVKNKNVPMPGVELISRNYIGVIELYNQLTGTPLHMQGSSVLGVEWVKDPALKKMGLYTAGAPHRNDATRHLLFYCVRTLNLSGYLTALKPDD